MGMNFFVVSKTGLKFEHNFGILPCWLASVSSTNGGSNPAWGTKNNFVDLKSNSALSYNKGHYDVTIALFCREAK